MSVEISPFQKNLANLLRARFPVLYISTWEEHRVLNIIRQTCSDEKLIRTPRTVHEWTITEGLTGGEKSSGSAEALLDALDRVQRHDEPAVFIFKDIHVFFGPENRPHDIRVVRKIRDLVPALKDSEKPKNIIFIAPTLHVPSDLEKDVTIVEFDLPSVSEIRTVLQHMIAKNRHTGRIEIVLSEEEEERLAKAALGLTLHEAENAFARAMVDDGRLDISDVAVVLEEKRQTIRKSGILDYINSDLKIDDVGGLQNLKRWLIRRNRSWLDSAARYNLPAPRGVLITGVPGCGKSLLAKAVSAMWQVPLLRLDIGRIFAGIVGSSEENMRRAISTAEAISPCVLWIDEIEKGFSVGGGQAGDGGTSTRVFGTFLTWMQEKTQPVFVVATANDISALPPEMMRKGRFDEIFFVDLPTKNERKEIFRLHLLKRLTNPTVAGEARVDDRVLTKLAEMTEGFVGAEIEQVVISALFDAYYEDRSVKVTDLIKAVEITVPLSVTQAEQIHAIRSWANLRAVAATQREDLSEYGTVDEPLGTPAKKKPDAANSIAGQRGGRSVDF